MALAECYFDETLNSGPRGVFAVAGFAIMKEHAIQLEAAWSAMLDEYGLEFFHMADCATGNGPFKHLNKEERTRAAKSAIDLIRQHVNALIWSSVEVSIYRERMKILEHWGGEYPFCAMSVFACVARWAEINDSVSGIHYYFEDGAPAKGHALHRISSMMEYPEFREPCRYGGMSFITKRQSGLVQAADLFAWHVSKDAKRAFDGQPIRKDFQALTDGKLHIGGHWHDKMLAELANGARVSARELGLPAALVPQIDRLARRTPKPARSR